MGRFTASGTTRVGTPSRLGTLVDDVLQCVVAFGGCMRVSLTFPPYLVALASWFACINTSERVYVSEWVVCVAWVLCSHVGQCRGQYDSPVADKVAKGRCSCARLVLGKSLLPRKSSVNRKASLSVVHDWSVCLGSL